METELRRLLRQIDEEYNAAYSGMNAFSSGAARHAFINARTGLLQDRKEAGFQGAAALWRSARCPRSSSSFSPPQAAKRKNATAVNARMGNIDTCRIELTTLVGDEEALRLMVQGNNEGNNQG